MPMPRLPETHHMKTQTSSAFQVKKKTAARAHKWRAIIIRVTPQLTGEEKVLSFFSAVKKPIVSLYCSTVRCAFVENRKGCWRISLTANSDGSWRNPRGRRRAPTFLRSGADDERLWADRRARAGRWKRG